MRLFAEIEEFPEISPEMINDMLDWPIDLDEEIKFEHDFDFQLCFETSPNVECTYQRCTFFNEKHLEMDKKLIDCTETKKEDVKVEPSNGEGGTDTVSETIKNPSTNDENQDPNISTNQEDVTSRTKASIGAQKTPEKTSAKKARLALKRKAPKEIRCKDCDDVFPSKVMMSLHTCHSILDKRMRIQDERRGRERRSTNR